GRMHEKPVGPHPCWSCQLAFEPETFAAFIPWLALNRDGLVVFIHPDTGDELKDHTEHAMWMGEMMELDLSVFG
ncbi:MAG: DOPA 4,5-dioxygenase family protein, partial [Shimia sp.]|nr:DOPA 4,5-dioxygenase family protein [Shimia sp.]